MTYDRVTRLLHLLIAAGITAQMPVSLVMVTPRPGRPENGWFELHETLGVVLLIVLAAHWLWSIRLTLASGGPLPLFPWFSPRGLKALGDDAAITAGTLLRGHLPPTEAPRPLPAAFQGLGLLVATFLGATGTVMLVGMGPQGEMAGLLHAIKESHETAGTLMWIYLVAHPSVAVIHQLAGHDTLKRMFRLN